MANLHHNGDPIWQYVHITLNSVLPLIIHLGREQLDIKEHFGVLFLLT